MKNPQRTPKSNRPKHPSERQKQAALAAEKDYILAIKAQAAKRLRRAQRAGAIPPDLVLDHCAEKIRESLSEAAGLATQAFDRMADAGGFLKQAKDHFKARRGYLVWLKRELPQMSRRTAVRYMALAAMREKLSANVGTLRTLPSSALYALAEAARGSSDIFATAVKEVERRAAAGERVRAREVRRLIRPSERGAGAQRQHVISAADLHIANDTLPEERSEAVRIYSPEKPAPRGPAVSLGSFAYVLQRWAYDIRFQRPEEAARDLLAGLPREEATKLVRALSAFLAGVADALRAAEKAA